MSTPRPPRLHPESEFTFLGFAGERGPDGSYKLRLRCSCGNEVVRTRQAARQSRHCVKCQRWTPYHVAQMEARRERRAAEPCICNRCHEAKPRSSFQQRDGRVNGRICRDCRNAAARIKHDPIVKRAQHRLKRYNITPAELDSIISLQEGVCPGCGEPLTASAHVDHDHSCCPSTPACGDCVRGMLCRDCNWILGHARDDPARLEALAGYLRAMTD